MYCKHNPDNLLYPTFRNGKRRSNASMENSFKHLCAKLEIDRDLQLTKTGQMKGLSLHSLRHTADTMANTAKGANVVNTALMMGHRAIRTENVYTHATIEGLKSVKTPSQIALDDYKEKSESDDKRKGRFSEMSNEDLYQLLTELKTELENRMK